MGWDCATVAVRVSWPTQLKWQQLGHRRRGAWCLSPCVRPRRRLAAWPCDQPPFQYPSEAPSWCRWRAHIRRLFRPLFALLVQIAAA